jgi:hypothetical protein
MLAKWLAKRSKKSQPLCLFVCSHSPHVHWIGSEGYDPANVSLPPTLARIEEDTK